MGETAAKLKVIALAVEMSVPPMAELLRTDGFSSANTVPSAAGHKSLVGGHGLSTCVNRKRSVAMNAVVADLADLKSNVLCCTCVDSALFCRSVTKILWKAPVISMSCNTSHMVHFKHTRKTLFVDAAATALRSNSIGLDPVARLASAANCEVAAPTVLELSKNVSHRLKSLSFVLYVEPAVSVSTICVVWGSCEGCGVCAWGVGVEGCGDVGRSSNEREKRFESEMGVRR